MSAGQISPFFSNIKRWEFLSFFYCVADVAKYLHYVQWVLDYQDDHIQKSSLEIL